MFLQMKDMDGTRLQIQTDKRTDGRTDELTDGQCNSYIPPNFFRGGYFIPLLSTPTPLFHSWINFLDPHMCLSLSYCLFKKITMSNVIFIYMYTPNWCIFMYLEWNQNTFTTQSGCDRSIMRWLFQILQTALICALHLTNNAQNERDNFVNYIFIEFL